MYMWYGKMIQVMHLESMISCIDDLLMAELLSLT